MWGNRLPHDKLTFAGVKHVGWWLPFFAREYHYLNHKFHVAWRGICVAQTWCGVCYGACGSCGMWWCVVCGGAAWYDSLYVPEPNRRPTRWQNDDIIHWKTHVACRQVPTVVNFTSRHVRWNDHSRDDKHTDWLKHCCTIPCWQNVKALKFSLRKMQCCMLHVCQFVSISNMQTHIVIKPLPQKSMLTKYNLWNLVLGNTCVCLSISGKYKTDVGET